MQIGMWGLKGRFKKKNENLEKCCGWGLPDKKISQNRRIRVALVAGIVFWLLYRVGIGVACFVSRCCVACVPAYLESLYCVFSLVKFLIHLKKKKKKKISA